MIVINFSVWEDIDSLFEYTYHTRPRRGVPPPTEWFDPHDGHYLVLWWVPAGHEPNVEEAEDRLDHLLEHGPTADAFTLKQRFPHLSRRYPHQPYADGSSASSSGSSAGSLASRAGATSLIASSMPDRRHRARREERLLSRAHRSARGR